MHIYIMYYVYLFFINIKAFETRTGNRYVFSLIISEKTPAGPLSLMSDIDCKKLRLSLGYQLPL